MLKSSLLVTILTFVSSIISFTNQILIAYFFGASQNVDAYLIGISAPVFITAAFGASLNYSLVPKLVKLKTENLYKHSYGELFLYLSLFSFAISLLGIVITEGAIKYFITSIPAQTEREVLEIARIAWLYCAVGIMNTFYSSVFVVNKRYLIPAILTMIPFLLISLFILVFKSFYGLIIACYAMLVGNVTVFLISYFLLKGELVFSSFRLLLMGKIEYYFSNSMYYVLAVTCFTIYPIIDSYFGSKLGEANVSYLGYSQRIIVGLGNLIIAGPSIILGLYFAELSNSDQKLELSAAFEKVVKIIVIFGLFFFIIINSSAEVIVKIIFERGSFTYNDTAKLAEILPYMSIGMIFMLCMVVTMRMLFAIDYVKMAASLGLTTPLLYFFCNFYLINNFGLLGVAQSYIISWAFTLLLSIAFLSKKEFIQFNFRDFLVFFVKLTISALITMFSYSFIFRIGSGIIANESFYGNVFNVLVSTLLAIIVYSVFMKQVFKITELDFIFIKLKSIIAHAK